jgi:hypothetical protein
VTPLPDPPTQALVQQPAVTQDPPKQQAVVQQSPPKQDPPKQDPPKQDPPKQQVAQKDPPKQDPPKQDPPKQQVAQKDPPRTHQDPPKQDPPKQDPPKQDPPKQDKQTRQAKPETREPAHVAKATPPKQDAPPKQEPAPKRVATTDTLDRADNLYRDKKFQEASSVLATAAKTTADSDEASTLRAKSQRLALLGRAFNNGMAPATPPKDAFDALVQANNYDQTLGSHFESEISQRLAAVAPKAAMSFAAARNFEKAHTAVQRAESLGAGGDQNVRLVKQKLESEAAALYNQAMKELDANPADAKDKLKQIKAMVDAKSPSYQKATKQLASG